MRWLVGFGWVVAAIKVSGDTWLAYKNTYSKFPSKSGDVHVGLPKGLVKSIYQVDKTGAQIDVAAAKAAATGNVPLTKPQGGFWNTIKNAAVSSAGYVAEHLG